MSMIQLVKEPLSEARDHVPLETAWISFTYGDKICFEFLVAWDAVAHTSNERTGLALLAPTAISEVPRPRDLNGS